MQNDKGERRFVDHDYAKLLAEGWKPCPGVPDPVDRRDTLLTVGPETAQILGLSKGTVASADKIATDRNLAIVADLSPGAGDQIVEFLGEPVDSVPLADCLHAEPVHRLCTPRATALPKRSAVVSLALLLGVPLLTGYAQWWEIARHPRGARPLRL